MSMVEGQNINVKCERTEYLSKVKGPSTNVKGKMGIV